jgi:hypothetical protein
MVTPPLGELERREREGRGMKSLLGKSLLGKSLLGKSLAGKSLAGKILENHPTSHVSTHATTIHSF